MDGDRYEPEGVVHMGPPLCYNKVNTENEEDLACTR